MGRNIWKDGIMGLVVGDALGLPVQFNSRMKLKENPVTKMEGHGTFNMPGGSWSDDSSLAIATLESIRRCYAIDEKDIMGNFVSWLFMGEFTPFGRAYDIGMTCDYAISKYQLERDVDTCGKTGERANGNGGLMRIMPVCLFAYEMERDGKYSRDEALYVVHRVTALTHNHKRAHMASGIYYFMVKEILDGAGTLLERMQRGMDCAVNYYSNDNENLEELEHYKRLFDLKEFADANEDSIKSSGYVVDSLEASVWCLINTASYKDALLKAVNLGNDTDTVGAIAGGLAGLYYGYDGIPSEWLEVIQKREWIEKFC